MKSIKWIIQNECGLHLNILFNLYSVLSYHLHLGYSLVIDMTDSFTWFYLMNLQEIFCYMMNFS